mgnify:CR=1 FL=1
MDTAPPLYYFWRVFYKDGSVQEQYDFNTGVSFPITVIDSSKVKEIGWFPIPPDLAEKLNERGEKATSNPLLPIVKVQVPEGAKPLVFMRNYITQEEYHKCNNCGRPFYATKFVGDKYYKSPVCPHCGAHDYYQCKDCLMKYNSLSETDDTPPEKGGRGHCKECGGYLQLIKVTSNQYSLEWRDREYAVGFEMEVNGQRKKFLVFVNGDGDVRFAVE